MKTLNLTSNNGNLGSVNTSSRCLIIQPKNMQLENHYYNKEDKSKWSISSSAHSKRSKNKRYYITPSFQLLQERDHLIKEILENNDKYHRVNRDITKQNKKLLEANETLKQLQEKRYIPNGALKKESESIHELFLEQEKLNPLLKHEIKVKMHIKTLESRLQKERIDRKKEEKS